MQASRRLAPSDKDKCFVDVRLCKDGVSKGLRLMYQASILASKPATLVSLCFDTSDLPIACLLNDLACCTEAASVRGASEDKKAGPQEASTSAVVEMAGKLLNGRSDAIEQSDFYNFMTLTLAKFRKLCRTGAKLLAAPGLDEHSSMNCA